MCISFFHWYAYMRTSFTTGIREEYWGCLSVPADLPLALLAWPCSWSLWVAVWEATYGNIAQNDEIYRSVNRSPASLIGSVNWNQTETHADTCCSFIDTWSQARAKSAVCRWCKNYLKLYLLLGCIIPIL